MGKRPAEFPSSLAIFPEPMRHHGDTNGLQIFRKNHAPPFHQGPTLGRAKQRETSARG